MVIHESAEDYLESILVLQERRGMVRSIDIVNELGFTNRTYFYSAFQKQYGETPRAYRLHHRK